MIKLLLVLLDISLAEKLKNITRNHLDFHNDMVRSIRIVFQQHFQGSSRYFQRI